ncbi:479_t:CDS:2, partial [Racocetra persica]
MFSSNKRKSISSKSAIAPQPIADDLKPSDLDNDSPSPDHKNFDRDLLKPQDHTKDCPSSSTLKSSRNSLDEKNILSLKSKPSTINNNFIPPKPPKPTKPSSLPIKINQSNHNESSLNLKNDPIISSSTKPPISSHAESKSRFNRSSAIYSSKLTSEPKSRGSIIGESPTKISQKHKRTGSAPILNTPSMSMINNLNKIISSKSMVNLNDEFEAKVDRETPKQYLERMMYSVSRSKLVTILTQKTDAFHQSALKAYMELFEFEKVPIDLALRKLLMECNLPKETQQIDRVMEAFAKSYHESNPDLFPSADDTDVNGQTMLGSPTQHRQMRLFSSKERRKSTRFKNDPYWVIQTKLPTEFKPKIKDIVPTENPYSYMGTLPALDITDLHRVFSTSNTIRITGVKNRRKSHTFKDTSGPFQSTDDDGTFLLNITKCGKLGRKIDLIDGKRKSSFVRHWRIYGVILSGSQLMFFKDEVGFNLQMKKLDNPEKSTLPILKPDVILMTADSVAVYDKNYKKHKNVFRLVCPKGHQYLFKAENEDEMNDWISKINYAATFKTAGLKMRNIRNQNISQLRRSLGMGLLGYSHDAAAKEAQGRTNLIRSKITELRDKISTLTSQLQADIRFRNNLFLMMPYKSSTRDRILKVATLVASRLKHTCLELSKLLCYHEILEKDLCSTVMEDKTYWQNRRSYFTPGDNDMDDNISSTETITNLSSKHKSHEMFGKLFIKEPINSNNKLLEPFERNSENTTRPATMGSLLRASASTLSLNSSSGESSRTSLSTYGDNEEGFDFHGNVSEYELDERDDCSFRDDASSIIALDDVKEQLSSVNGSENDDYNA